MNEPLIRFFYRGNRAVKDVHLSRQIFVQAFEFRKGIAIERVSDSDVVSNDAVDRLFD